MLMLSAGATAGFSATLIPQLQNDGLANFNTEMISWVGTCNNIIIICNFKY